MKSFSKQELVELLEVAKSTAKKAGKKLVQKQKHLDSLMVTIKKAQGVVSLADIESENIIIKQLRAFNSEIPFLGEESSYLEFQSEKEKIKHFENEPYAWVVDPLDGTNNFLAGLDYYAVCIALVKKGKPVLGVVYRPRSDEMYYALKGRGTYVKRKGREAKRICQSKTLVSMNDSLLVTGFIAEKGKLVEKEFQTFKRFIGKCRGIRRMGSAALDLCLVAEGIFGGFWERGLAPWDVAAAGLILQEAGGKVTDYNGCAFSPFDETILGARMPVYSQMKKILN